MKGNYFEGFIKYVRNEKFFGTVRRLSLYLPRSSQGKNGRLDLLCNSPHREDEYLETSNSPHSPHVEGFLRLDRVTFLKYKVPGLGFEQLISRLDKLFPTLSRGRKHGIRTRPLSSYLFPESITGCEKRRLLINYQPFTHTTSVCNDGFRQHPLTPLYLVPRGEDGFDTLPPWSRPPLVTRVLRFTTSRHLLGFRYPTTLGVLLHGRYTDLVPTILWLWRRGVCTVFYLSMC